MIKGWFYRKTNDFYHCPNCEDTYGRFYYLTRVPCLNCGNYTKNKKSYKLRDWVERAIDILCVFLLLLLPLVLYYAIVESYFKNGGDLRKGILSEYR